MKIYARITEQFTISEIDMKCLIEYANGNEEREDRVLDILAVVFGEREGYIPGFWLEDKAEELGIRLQDNRGCDDIEIG